MALIVAAAVIAEKFNPQSAQQIPGLHRDALPAATDLMRLGYNHVYFLAGGYAAWQRHTGK
jgi:hypothetical protein